MDAKQSTAVATVSAPQAASALPVRSMSEMATAGQLLAQSGMFGVQNAAAGFVVVATCYQQQITLVDFFRTYHLIGGRPSMRADAMLAEFRKRGGRVKIVENSVKRAAAEATFEGQTVPFEYTLADAQRTGDCYEKDGKTLKYTWQKRPEDMLWARMISRMVRRLCPEINAGLYSSEEVEDMVGAGGGRGAAPRAELTPDEAARRAKPVDVTTAAAEPFPVSDTLGPEHFCPVGGEDVQGQPWTAFETEVLVAALEADNDEITEAHRECIRAEITRREGGAE